MELILNLFLLYWTPLVSKRTQIASTTPELEQERAQSRTISKEKVELEKLLKKATGNDYWTPPNALRMQQMVIELRFWCFIVCLKCIWYVAFVSKTKDRQTIQNIIDENAKLKTELELLGDQKLQVN